MAAQKSTSPIPTPLPPLGQHRSRSGISLEQIAEETKISIRFLRAIEAERFEELPGGIFARSYIRQYAAAIGFDEEELLRRYRDAVGENGDGRRSGSRRDAGQDTPGSRRAASFWMRLLGALRFLP